MLVIVVCVDKPDVPGLTNGALDDAVVVFFAEEVTKTATDVDNLNLFSAMTQVKLTHQ